MQSTFRTLASALFVLLAAGCGRAPEPGGRSVLVEAPGAVAALLVEGSPYQMGWWQGSVWKEAIRARVAAARRLEPQEFIELFADQTRMRLSERMRQELEGLAAGSGTSTEDLLRAEVAAEALRFKGGGARLEGAAGLLPDGAGYEARLLLSGQDVATFAREAVLIHRRPVGAPASVALSWPGSLGGLACVTEAGAGYMLAEVEMRDRRRLGFGGGRPFAVMAREALEATENVEALVAEMTGTMGHIGLGFRAQPDGQPPVRALAGVHVYGAPDLPWALGRDAFLAVGPYPDPEGEEARALRAQVVAPAELVPAARWLAFESLLVPEGGAPRATIIWREGTATLRFEPGGERAAAEITLR